MTTTKPSEPDYYKILGLSPSAGPREVQLAFSDLIRKHREQPGETDLVAIDRARQINIAGHVLGDPERRLAYDESRGIFFPRPAEQGEQRPQTDRPSARAPSPAPQSSPGQAAVLPVGKSEGANALQSPEQELLSESREVGKHSEPDDRIEAGRSTHSRGFRSWKMAAAVAGLAMFAGLMTLVFEPDRSSNEPIPAASDRSPRNAQQSERYAGLVQAVQGLPADDGSPAQPRSDVPEESGTSLGPNGAESGAISQSASERSFPGIEPSNAQAAPKAKGSSQASLNLPSGSEDLASNAPEPNNDAAEAEQASSTPIEPPPPPPAVRTRAKSAEYVSGNLFDGNAPVGRLRGTVVVRFTVDQNGRANSCRATGGSGNAALGSITCQLVEDRLRFSPARDSAGRPTPSELTTTYNWSRKPRR